MKATVQRFIAILLLVVPGIMATVGFLEMKDAVFNYFAATGSESAAFEWLKMSIGLVLFLAGAGFISGWVFFRDRKRNYLQPRFKAKKRPDGSSS